MKMLKTLIASSLVFGASAAFAAPITFQTIETGSDVEALRRWSSVCVGNLKLDHAVKAEYQYTVVDNGFQGDDNQPAWKEVEIKPNTIFIFSQRYPGDIDPMKFTIRFKATETDGAAVLTYDLAQTETLLRPGNCQNLENYRFEKTDAPDGAIDLLHVQ